MSSAASEVVIISDGDDGIVAKLCTHGATLMRLQIRRRHCDGDDTLGDVVLGFEESMKYESEHPYIGCVVGPVANRISNASFHLNGKEYVLENNDGGRHHLHGGSSGFSHRKWNTVSVSPNAVTFSIKSGPGEEGNGGGYPGALDVSVTYTVLCVGSYLYSLKIEYKALSTGDTASPVNLTNHSYFNLSCDSSCTSLNIRNHELSLFADTYLPVNEATLPTGEVVNVKGTLYDFEPINNVGKKLDDVLDLYTGTRGLDNSFDLNRHDIAAVLNDTVSGRRMVVRTSMPVLHIYTGNFLDGSVTGREGIPYTKHAGICFETQFRPDALNQPWRQQHANLLEPGESFEGTTEFEFLDGV